MPNTSSGKISPAILFILIILALIFFISGLLHLLVRFLMRKRSSISQSNRYPDNISTSDTFQRQLQQLFHLHDSGLDQAFIDALPVFQYKEIVGLKEPFDCAVCLCEFLEQDKLRLLPICSHAFHIDCIDKWLLSNSSCPLCRGTLYTPGIAIENPVFDFDESRDDDGEVGIGGGEKVFPVRLGKFRSTNNEKKIEVNENEKDLCETSSRSLDARRCYSMGSYQYIVAESVLQVALCPNAAAKPSSKGQNGNSTATTAAIANAHANANANANADTEGRKISSVSKKESLSVSKIWLWSKKSKFPHSSTADFSGVTVDMSLPWTNKSQLVA